MASRQVSVSVDPHIRMAARSANGTAHTVSDPGPGCPRSGGGGPRIAVTILEARRQTWASPIKQSQTRNPDTAQTNLYAPTDRIQPLPLQPSDRPLRTRFA
jgi:hypothetical protein